MSAVTEGDISPWATAIHQLVHWVGNGRTLTTTGQLRVADGLELVQLLGTGDDPHGGAGQRRLASSRDLPVLQSLLTGAVDAGLLRTPAGPPDPGQEIRSASSYRRGRPPPPRSGRAPLRSGSASP